MNIGDRPIGRTGVFGASDLGSSPSPRADIVEKYRLFLRKLDVIEEMVERDDPSIFDQIERFRVHLACEAARELHE